MNFVDVYSDVSEFKQHADRVMNGVTALDNTVTAMFDECDQLGRRAGRCRSLGDVQVDVVDSLREFQSLIALIKVFLELKRIKPRNAPVVAGSRAAGLPPEVRKAFIDAHVTEVYHKMLDQLAAECAFQAMEGRER